MAYLQFLQACATRLSLGRSRTGGILCRIDYHVISSRHASLQLDLKARIVVSVPNPEIRLRWVEEFRRLNLEAQNRIGCTLQDLATQLGKP